MYLLCLSRISSELKTIESLLPPNCTARAYISVVINITRSILKSGQGKSASQCHFSWTCWILILGGSALCYSSLRDAYQSITVLKWRIVVHMSDYEVEVLSVSHICCDFR